MGKGKWEVEGGSAPARDGSGLIPTDAEIRAYCESYRNLALGIEKGIPEVWWASWVARQLDCDRPFPANWQRSLTLAFHSDWMNAGGPGYAKAHGLNGAEKKPSGAHRPADGVVMTTNSLREACA